MSIGLVYELAISRLSKLGNIITLNGSRLSKHCDVVLLTNCFHFFHPIFMEQKKRLSKLGIVLQMKGTQ